MSRKTPYWNDALTILRMWGQQRQQTLHQRCQCWTVFRWCKINDLHNLTTVTSARSDKLRRFRLIITCGGAPRANVRITSPFDQKWMEKSSAVCVVVVGACEALSNKLIFDQSAFESPMFECIAFDQFNNQPTSNEAWNVVDSLHAVTDDHRPCEDDQTPVGFQWLWLRGFWWWFLIVTALMILPCPAISCVTLHQTPFEKQVK